MAKLEWITLDKSIELENGEVAVEVVVDKTAEETTVAQVGIVQDGGVTRRKATPDEADMLAGMLDLAAMTKEFNLDDVAETRD